MSMAGRVRPKYSPDRLHELRGLTGLQARAARRVGHEHLAYRGAPRRVELVLDHEVDALSVHNQRHGLLGPRDGQLEELVAQAPNFIQGGLGREMGAEELAHLGGMHRPGPSQQKLRHSGAAAAAAGGGHVQGGACGPGGQVGNGSRGTRLRGGTFGPRSRAASGSAKFTGAGAPACRLPRVSAAPQR